MLQYVNYVREVQVVAEADGFDEGGRHDVPAT